MSTFIIVFLNGLGFSAILFLLASGLTLILGLARVVNFAHGSFYILGGYLFISIVNLTGNWWMGLFIAPIILGLVGGVIEYFLIKPIYKKDELLQLILTFGIVLVIEDSIKLVWGSVPYGTNIVPTLLSGSIDIMGKALPVSSLATIIVAILVGSLLGLLFIKTRLGKQITASSSDMQMGEALGINVPRLFTSVFAFGTLFAGLGGCLITLRVGLLPSLGLEYLIYAFAVVVIGGLGSYKGSIYGALIVGIFYSFGILIIPDFAMVFVFGLLLVTLLVKPRGLFGALEYTRPSSVEGQKRIEIGAQIFKNLPARKIKTFGILAILGFIILIPYYVSSYWVIFLTEALVLVILALSLNLLLTGGMLSLAHGAFFGSGAYAASLVLINITNSVVISFLLSIVVAGVIALLIGLMSLRHVEMYFSLLTLAFAQFVYTLIFKWKSLTGGDDGLSGIPLPAFKVFGFAGNLFVPDSEIKYFYLVLVVFIVCLLFIRMVMRSPFGQMLHAIRENPERVTFLGINRDRYKLAVFVFAGSIAGLAGAVFAPFQMVIGPIAAHWTKAVDPLFMNIIGGINTMLGPSVGAIIFLFFKDWLSSIMEYWRIVFGIILILVALVFPKGVIEYLKMGLCKIVG